MKKLLGILSLIVPIILLNGCGGSEDEQSPESVPVVQEEETDASESPESSPAEEESPDAAPVAEEPATPEAVSKEATPESQATEKMQEIAVEAIAEIVETVKEESNSFTNSDVGASAIKQLDNASRSSKWSKPKEVPVEEQTQEEPAEEDALEEEKPEGEATEEEAAEDKTPAI